MNYSSKSNPEIEWTNLKLLVAPHKIGIAETNGQHRPIISFGLQSHEI